MENLIIQGTISTTSNKQSEKFVAKTPQKTAYITVDESTAEKLEDFGLRQYTSKNGESFFALKVVNELQMYFDKSKVSTPLPTSTQDPNFKTADGVVIGMNIIKGENLGNSFFRLQAVLLKQASDITQIEAENPFA